MQESTVTSSDRKRCCSGNALHVRGDRKHAVAVVCSTVQLTATYCCFILQACSVYMYDISLNKRMNRSRCCIYIDGCQRAYKYTVCCDFTLFLLCTTGPTQPFSVLLSSQYRIEFELTLTFGSSTPVQAVTVVRYTISYTITSLR
jgi:hypothetical protein